MNPEDTPRTAAIVNPVDLKGMAKVGFWTVDDAIKDLIENIDPGRHQFLPITLKTWIDEKPIEGGERYFLNVYSHQFSVIDELTSAKAPSGFEETRERLLINYLVPKVTIDPSKLSRDIHLWRECRYDFSLFISDTLYEHLADRGIELPTIDVDEVD